MNTYFHSFSKRRYACHGLLRQYMERKTYASLYHAFPIPGAIATHCVVYNPSYCPAPSDDLDITLLSTIFPCRVLVLQYSSVIICIDSLLQ